ncbi:MAG: hypothetical protein AB1720_11705 [Pseudomonadota bacterium]
MATEESSGRSTDIEAWQLGEIEQAIQEADRGDFANPSDMADLPTKMQAEWGTALGVIWLRKPPQSAWQTSPVCVY